MSECRADAEGGRARDGKGPRREPPMCEDAPARFQFPEGAINYGSASPSATWLTLSKVGRRDLC
jgi:hypothetical protein